MQIQLGSTYTDLITGFRGIAIGHCIYLTGCNQTLLQPAGKAGADKPESHWFDDQRLEHYGKAKPVSLDNGKTPGSDKPAPKI